MKAMNLTLGLILLLSSRVLAQTNGSRLRLAIVAEESSAIAAADLLTVELSRKEQITLLERTEIDRVYREQGLSAANLDYLKLGQVLGADGLLLLEPVKEGTNVFLGSRLVAVKPGVVIGSSRSPWPSTEASEWAKRVVSGFDSLLPKLGVLVKDAIPLSVVSLRSTVRTAEAQALEKELTLLLIHRMTRAREVFVLERQRLREVLFERELQPQEASAFWTGRFLIEGALNKNGYDPERATVNARLTAPQGGPATEIEVTGPRTNLVGLVELMVTRILAGLKRSSDLVEWHPLEEAGQFLEEAKWAHRWGLFSEAQMASETAWALGRRTKEVAALRIRVYGDETMLPGYSPCQIPTVEVPEAAKLRPAERALELFSQDARLAFTNPASPDVEWHDLGLRILRGASAQLRSFYRVAEARQGNEDELARLRGAARQTLSIIETNEVWPANRREGRTRADYCEGIAPLKWETGGLWFERPEDALPMFRQMMEPGFPPSRIPDLEGASPVDKQTDSGFHPPGLPLLVGWSWEDRKRVPGLMRQFVQSVCASTNPSVRLEGLYLELVRAPLDPEGKFHQHESELFSTLWEQRDVLYRDAGLVSLLSRVDRVLRLKYGFVDPNKYLDLEPFADLKHRLRMDYLRRNPSFDLQVFNQFFPSGSRRDETQDQAKELVLLLEGFKKRFPAADVVDYRIRVMQSTADAAPLRRAEPDKPKPTVPADVPLVAKFIPWRINEAHQFGSKKETFQSLVRGNKLWFLVHDPRVIPPAYDPKRRITEVIGVDPETGVTEVVQFPEHLGFPDNSFEVTQDSIYLSVQNRLQRYRFSTKAWEGIPLPTESGARVSELGKRLYLATGEGLLEVSPDTKEIQILASSRRHPPASDLDALWDPGASIYSMCNGRLGVFSMGHVFLFDPTSRDWTHTAPLPKGHPYHVVRFPSEDGLLLLLSTFGVRQRLLAFWDDSPGVDSLLELNVERERPDPDLEKAVPPPRWNWPQIYPLETSDVSTEGKILWVLTPRKTWWYPGTPLEPIAFADSRHATLLRFESGIREALCLPIRFEHSDPSFEPLDPSMDQGNFPDLSSRQQIGSRRMPFWGHAPQGLVFVLPSLNGHWLIPKIAMESRLDALRKKFRAASANELQRAKQSEISTNLEPSGVKP